MGNSLPRKRLIKVQKPISRLTKQEKHLLKEAFDRIQECQMINEYQFRMEVLGPQVPEVIGAKIFQMFTPDYGLAQQMSFEDLVACFVVFQHGTLEEMGQFCFEIMKFTNGSNHINKESMLHFGQSVIALKDPSLTSYFRKTKLDPGRPIQKDDFVITFSKVHEMPLFSWVPKLIDGYNQDTLNLDGTKGSDLVRRLTVISNERTKIETQQMGFESNEFENMNEFFNREIKKNDAKEVLKTFQKLFKDIKNAKLRRYFIDNLTKNVNKVLNQGPEKGMLREVKRVLNIVCKEKQAEKKVDFLFEVFSCHSGVMKKKQMKEFAEIFDLGSNFFVSRGGQLTLAEFKEDMLNIMLDFELYESTRFIMMAMLGLNAQSDQDQKQSILAAMDNNHNLETYINEHLEEEDTFYLIEKQFWEQWCNNVGFNDSQNISFKREKSKFINNEKLLEPKHDFRLREVTYNEDFLIVPKYVFYPLSKWYQCTKVIERKVIKYKIQKNKGLTLFKSKKNNNSQIPLLQNLDHFQKTVNDTITYELEVYPKFIYYEMINEKGEKPHQKAIVNQKIDKAYMKKVLKSDKIPLYELSISRKTTFEELLKIITPTFKENPKRGRLWIEDQVISGAKLEETLEDFGISIGQVIYAEYANQNNQWPTDKNLTSSVKTTAGEKEFKIENKTSGLYNLGNTCYMNSALQCLANTKLFYEYFVKEQKYKKQMNLKNPLGHQGELAQNFAQLINRMWNNPSVVMPRSFKNCISNISEQFQGYDQQDSQEFVSFLIDGLHEELNLRNEKPYTQNPESQNRKILELGLEAWSNTLQRDWSFIFFQFYGQLKSTLNCKVCNKVSTTFDMFTNIPLSLPEPTKIMLNITIYRLPNDIKDILSGLEKPDFKRMDSARSDEVRGMSMQGDRDPANIAKFQETFKHMTNDQPIRISLRVHKDIRINSIIQQIMQIKEVNIDPLSDVSALVLHSSNKGTVRGIFNSEFKLSQYNVYVNEIEAIEVMTNKGRNKIREFYYQNPSYIVENPDAHLTCLIGLTEKVQEPKIVPSPIQQATGKKRKHELRQSKNESTGLKISRCNLFNTYTVACEKFDEIDENDNFPQDIYVVAYHRRFIKKNYFFFCPYQPQLLAYPLIFILPLRPTGRRIYEEVWLLASQILKKSSIYRQKKNLWWEKQNWEEILERKEQMFQPFVLKTVERQGFQCSQCNWMNMCSGCILPPTNEFIDDFFKKCHLVIEWHSHIIEDEYNQDANEVLQHSSTSSKEIQQEENINLEDCLRKFHEVEDMGSQDHIFCSDCKQQQEHLKHLEIFRPPPILIIQLKRFSSLGAQRNKLQTYVEFPLYNLDVSTFVTDHSFLDSQNISQKYDLYGIINHYGSLHFGHYVSVVKNPHDSKWYMYDDSSRAHIAEDQILKDSAYILFYMRKDLQHKKLEDILPNIKDLFPGKPIKTEKGDGFILSKAREPEQYNVQLMKVESPIVIQASEILQEKDSNEIHYDEKEMQEIEIQNKEKQNEQKQNRMKKCRLCSSLNSRSSKTKPDKSRRPSIKQNMGCIIY